VKRKANNGNLPSTTKIREFLQEAFSDAELKTLCADYFPKC